jgi:hypothetical protein
MDRRYFVTLLLGSAAGAALTGVSLRGGLRWSSDEGFPGMPVRIEGLPGSGEASAPSRRLVITVTRAGGQEEPRPLLDVPLASIPATWRIPSLRKGFAPDAFLLHARVLEDEHVLAETSRDLSVRYRSYGFSR